MHNDIPKYNLSRVLNLHKFPALCSDQEGSVECRNENKFKRFNENTIFDELILKKYNKMSPEEIIQIKIEEVEKNAIESGYENGFRDGVIAGKKEIQSILMNMQKVIDEISKIKISLTKITEYETVELSLAIAKKIVGNELSINKKVIIKIVKEALKKVDGHENIKIKINPEDMNLLIDDKMDLKECVNCIKDIDIIGDENVSSGGCIIETNIGDIDARIETQMKVIEDAFKLECV